MKRTLERTLRIAPGLLMTSMLSHSIVWAQDGAVDKTARLETVIITTQKTEENLQTTPLAVTAFSGEELEARGIADLKGITERTPGFTMGEFNPGQTQLYIRGIGSNEDGAGGDQSVVVFIDEAYIGRSAGQDLDLFDIERVEVLRGPQGTLFGRNVVGGVVNVVTRKPHDTPEAVIEGEAGTYGLLNIRGRANVPLADNVFGKISFSSRQRDGYVKNRIYEIEPALTGLDAPTDIRIVDRFSSRAGLRFLPSESVDINLTASYSTVDEQATSPHLIDGTPESPSLYVQQIPNFDDSYRYTAVVDEGSFENETFGLIGNAAWDINDALTFTSITSYREVDAEHIPGNIVATAADLELAALVAAVEGYGTTGSNYYADDSQTFTQELRLTYVADKMNAVGGLYYLDEDAHRNECMSLSLVLSAAFQTNPANESGCADARNTTTSWAAFGQVTYDLTDKLSVILGGRYTFDEKHNRQVGNASLALAGPSEDYNTDVTVNWDAFTGKLGLDYAVTEDVFLYAVVSEGYKSGGFGPGLTTTGAQAATPFDPEYATMVEVGAKTEWFDNRLRMNVAYSDTDYEDLQILQLLVPIDAPDGTPGSLLTQNAATAKIKALEAEFSIALTESLLLSGNYAYLDTEYADFFVPGGYRPPVDGEFDTTRVGNVLRNAPENAYSLALTYTHDLPGGAGMAFRVDHRHKDLVYQDPDNLDFAAVPEHDLTDMSVTWTSPSDKLAITGFATNLFDEEYIIHNYPVSGSGFGLAGPPQMFGVRVNYSFFSR